MKLDLKKASVLVIAIFLLPCNLVGLVVMSHYIINVIEEERVLEEYCISKGYDNIKVRGNIYVCEKRVYDNVGYVIEESSSLDKDKILESQEWRK